MRYTAAHWGAYSFAPGDADLTPLADDPAPSRVGRGWVSASRNRAARILAPAVRAGWLRGDRGAGRNDDSYVEVSWERATALAADEIARVAAQHGNAAIFGGSYGWSSAGRFHHAQGQMRRLLGLAGGYTGSTETYSHAAAEVLFPHVLGLSNKAFQDQMTAMPLVAARCDVILAVGGIAGRTAQITSAGTSRHEVTPWLEEVDRSSTRLIHVGPERGEAGEWLSIRPGTDTALLLALIHRIVSEGREDRAFLARCTSGWDRLRAYVMGESDGAPKSPDWAGPICDVEPRTIADLADLLARSRSMIALAWGLQRADHGEQPIWAGLALACVLGQIGQEGTGYGFGYGSTTPVGRPARLIPWPSLPGIRNPVTQSIPVARIADALLHPGATYTHDGETRAYPDLRLVWWAGGNPFHHHQDLFRLERAWTRPETVIVSDHSWTATARRADIVLPATTPLERDDLMMNRRDPVLLYLSRFHETLGQARDDYDICREIADRLGVEEAFSLGRSAEDWMRSLWSEAGQVAERAGFTLPDFDSFRAKGRFDLPRAREERIAFRDFVADPETHALATESGRLVLASRTIEGMALSDCPPHPTWLPPVEGGPLEDGSFHLISGQPATRLHSQNDQGSESAASKVLGREVASIHPKAAARLGIGEGEVIRLWNDRGACLCAAHLTDDIRADCLSLPTGAWFDPQVIDGARIEVHGNPNALTRDKGCSGLSQGNIAHTCVVRAEKWTGPLPALAVDRPPPFVPG